MATNAKEVPGGETKWDWNNKEKTGLKEASESMIECNWKCGRSHEESEKSVTEAA